MRFRLFLIMIAAAISMRSIARRVDAQTKPLDAEVITKIERLVTRSMNTSGAPGLSLAVATENQLRYAQAFGLADIENQIAVTPRTRFRTASIAKPMTAVIILSLAEEGTIDLDAEVQRYCAEYPQKRWPLTSRQLLGHLGGVRHYKSAQEARSTSHFFSLKSALTTFANDPLRHQPGAKFLYTTFGYNLLGSIAEGATGHHFMELLRSRVLALANMTDTVADDQIAITPRRTRGYLRATQALLKALPADHNLKLGQIYNAPLHDTSMKIPGGGLLSTAPDLVRFAIAVNTRQLVNEATLAEMWSGQKTRDGAETNYGLGWQVGRRSGRQLVSHGGGQAGTSTMLVLFPENGTSVAIMCNLQGVRLRNLAIEIANTVRPTTQPIDYGEALAKLNAAIQHEIKQKQLPAFSMSLVDGNRVVWADGFGYQDAAQKKPATAATVYRVGSISKLFTDIAVMQLVEEGKLDLDAPVQRYLPDFQPRNPFGVPVTLRQLMSHRSGLVREPPVGHYFDPDEPTLAATVASLNETELVYAPETKTKYSNAAIAVVGAVLEQQLDSSQPERIRQSILDPLAMSNSSFVITPRVKPQLATGWMRTYDGRRLQAPEFLLGTGPAGNLYASVLDLSKFLSCLFNDGQTESGRILKPETLGQMTVPIRDANGMSQGFGLGFHVEEFDGYRKIGHGGAVYGFSTQLEAISERKLGVAAAAALDGSNGIVRRLADYALRLMIATQDGQALPSYPTTSPIPTARARALTGTYREVDGKRHIRISELNGDVFMHQGVFRHQLRSASDNGNIITDDAIGFGTQVKLDGDRLSVDNALYQRISNQPPADTPDKWKGLIGEYGWDHNVLYILEDHGQLYALIEWFFYYPLREVHEDVYAFPDYGLYHGEQLKFTRNEQGSATQVVAAEVRFSRRDVGTQDGQTFQITPVKPIDELRDAALAASPPVEPGKFLEADLVELDSLDPTIKLDIRYASENNFTGSVFYKQSRAFMQRPAAEAVARANARLKARGLGLLIHDAYRPWHVTKMFWDATPSELKDFVANPANGSRHNRGCAVDLTLYDLQSGKPIQMVAGYDEFSPRSFPLYPGGTSRQRWYRTLLRETMESAGFTIYKYEWWHFDYRDWKQYRIGNATFEDLLK